MGTKRKKDLNGWLTVSDNPISKVGVFDYLGSEIGAPDPKKIYRVYRPAEELERNETIESFKLLPFIDEHEMLGEGATPAERKGISGMIGENVYFEAPYLKGNIKVLSSRTLDKVEGGKIELSPGYLSTYDFEEGVFEGEKYDAIQRNIRGNHLALVKEGRTGKDVAIQDHSIFTIDTRELVSMNLEELIAAIKALSEEDKAKLKTALTVQDEDPENKEPKTQDEDPELTAEEKEALEAAAKAAAEAEKIAAEAAAAATKAAEGGNPEDAKTAEELAAEAAATAGEAEEKATLDALRKEIKTLKAQVATQDSASIFKQIAQRDSLATKLKPFIGTFDHSAMTSSQVAEYGIKKLGIRCAKGTESIALDAWMQGRTPDSKKATSTMDGASVAQSAVQKWGKK